jgi:hypothetical protein
MAIANSQESRANKDNTGDNKDRNSHRGCWIDMDGSCVDDFTGKIKDKKKRMTQGPRCKKTSY